jgi:hypothetical protein
MKGLIMEATKISDGVRDILEFMKTSDISMAEQITMLRSTAELLNQIILSEATAASLVATFQKIHGGK